MWAAPSWNHGAGAQHVGSNLRRSRIVIAVSPWAAPLRLLSIDLPKGVLETHFVLSDKALQRGRYHTVLTHMLLHESHAVRSVHIPLPSDERF
jgi:hypothetical protein